MATGQAIVLRALTQMKSTLTDADKRMFSETGAAEVWREARTIEKELADRRELLYMKRIEPYLHTLESYAGVLEVFCQGYSPMAFVWGPIKLMLQLARNYTNILECILQSFSDIAQVLPRMEKLKATFGGSPDFDQAIGLIYSDIIEFLQRAYKFFRCKGWHFWFTFNWGLFERPFNSIIQRLSRHCELLDREAAAIHFFEMKEFRTKHHREEEEFEKRIQGEMSNSVVRWLSAAEDEQEEHLHRINDIRHPGTCNWVLKNDQMAAWIGDEGGDPVMWMTGIPGAGKSFLCSFLVENLRTRSDRSSLYYFCGKRQTHEDTCATILRTLACQMLQDNPDIVPLVHQAYYQKMSNRSGPAMRKMLCQVLPTIKTTRVVIDGIDESGHEVQRDVLKSLLEIQKHAGYKCKIIISSREEPEIRTILSTKSHLNLAGNTSEGLALYIATETEKIKRHYQGLKPSLVSRVEDRLRSKALGMFLWVRLVTTMLTQCTSETELEQAIEQLPEGLEEAYGKILQRIIALGSVVKDRAFKILFWICTAYRPITVHEVADGIVLHHRQRILSKETRSRNLKRDILDVCAPLLESSSSGVLDAVHFSAKEYLVDKQSGPFIDVAKAHFHVAFSCIINLTTALDLVPQQCNTINDVTLETRVAKGNFGLFSYAYECWTEHTLAYLALAPHSDLGIREIIAALTDFSQVSKHPLTISGAGKIDLQIGYEFTAGVTKIKEYPTLYNLISKWLLFKSRSRDRLAAFENVDAEQRWKLQTDETFLSLIDSRLGEITEKLMTMPSELPSHIEKSDHADFIQRFKLSCRFPDCNLHFENPEERDMHEESHIPSYPCFQCDFVERGFKSRKDLTKHIQRYHMHADDFDVPVSLHSAQGQRNEEDVSSISTTSTVSGRWNKEGRRVLQQGFHRILSRVESQIALDLDENTDFHKNHTARVESIRNKIQSQRYQGLGEFKNELSSLVSFPQGPSTSVATQENLAICDTEIKEAMSNYPAFAIFDHEASKHTILGGVFDDYDHRLRKANPGDNQVEESLSSDLSIAERRPYWSVTEDDEFPELLRRCGRDFIKIADYLKTKTPAEVDQHLETLVERGRADLAEAANYGASNLQRQIPVEDSTDGLDDPDPELLEVVSNINSLSAELPQTHQGFGTMVPYVPELQDLSRDHRMYPRNGLEMKQPEPGTNVMIPDSRKAKRKLRPRALCPQCNSELHDEYAVRKHILRIHTPTRKVWKCEDISVDKQFLAKCKSCSNSKRYNNRHHAENHLRDEHFSPKTPVEVLHRWMREAEEPNPNFRSLTPQIQPQSRQSKKRQKKGAEPISLAPILFDPSISKSDLLPSMLIEAPQTRNEAGQPMPPISSTNPDEDHRKPPSPSKSEGATLEDYELLTDVSFDNFLPHSIDVLPPIDTNGPAHRANRTLIKPDQVSRLPHLDGFRKTACQDQVNALYHNLDRLKEGSARYQEVLRELISLSRFLMSNLRDWRRRSNIGPSLPVTL